MKNLLIVAILLITKQVIASKIYPDKNLTPGAIDCSLTKEYLCTHSTKERRNVPKKLKDQVCKNYGDTCAPGKQEIDHFVPLTLGGKNDIENLWPEDYKPSPGAHEKDALEMFLHLQVCSNKISLYDAQQAIRVDWLKSYNLMKAKKPLVSELINKDLKKCIP